MTIIRTDSTVTVGANVTLADSEDLHVAASALVASSGGAAVIAAYDYHHIAVSGEVVGAAQGILLGTGVNKLVNLHDDIWIAEGGLVSASGVGISSYGAYTTITNAGEVYGYNDGLNHTGDYLTLTNQGLISGSAYGVELRGNGNYVVNYGTITGFPAGLFAAPDSTTTNSSIALVNYGTIGGGGFSAGPAQGAYVFKSYLVNHGYIASVAFSDGDDVYDGSDGVAGSVSGDVGNDNLIGGNANDLIFGGGGTDSLQGGAGNDTLVGGSEADTLEGGDGNDVIRPGPGYDFIDGGAGRDLLDFSGSGGVVVSFVTGRTSFSDAFGDYFTNIEGASGGAGNDNFDGDAEDDWFNGRGGSDTIYAGAGNDTISGGDGNDWLIGGTGRDVLTGGTGPDTFRFDTIQDSPNDRAFDRITDFSQGELDKIHLSFIDADTTVAGDQAFAFIGTGAFTAAGQIRFVASPSWGTLFYGNVDNNVGPDFAVFLTGQITLTAADFVL